MTFRTNARIEGVTLILYFAAGIASLVLSGRAVWLIVKGVAASAQRQSA